MKIQFDSSLQYQLDAISSVVNIFQGQEKCETNFTVYSPDVLNKQQTISFNEVGFRNRLNLTKTKLLENVQQIQLSNGLNTSSYEELDRDYLDFTIEMETGTGKTYVYLRTIMELYRKYGFSKHIIVVPSIPIKEGVYKSLQITQQHFKELYEHVNYHFFVYDSNKLGEVRSFSTNERLEIMVINIDAFSKSFKNPDESIKANVIHRYNDKLGCKPLDLISNTQPFVFVDEPQTTMSTKIRKTAIEMLDPLAIIRYSATHIDTINLVYKLDAVEAYESKLVKQIEVGSVQTKGIYDQAYIKLLKVNVGNGFPTARIEIDAFSRGKIKRKQTTVRKNVDLEQLTKRPEYQGFIVKDIYGSKGGEYIDFTSNDKIVRSGQSIGEADDLQVKTLMISKTIEEHLDKEKIRNQDGIKVLSLFFIDEVAKYRKYTTDGNYENGIYAQIFEREYNKLIRKPKYNELFKSIRDLELDASQVHNGYFSKDKRGKFKNTDKRTGQKTLEDTYGLIMRDKEKLLSFDSKLRFIFSHSALKEGWDNPNVFQICYLRDIGGSSITPRQQIGRGLRLCVNQIGQRVHGHKTNILTVIANESYHNFVDSFQKELQEVTGIKFGIVKADSFSTVVIRIDEGNRTFLGFEKSKQLYQYFISKEYLTQSGKVLDKLRIDLKEDKVELLPIVSENLVIKQVLTILKNVAGKLEIKNKEDRIRVPLNTEVLDNKEFRTLWEKVKFKTTFSVNFDSNSLIKKCIDSINTDLVIQRGKLVYTKSPLMVLNVGGIDDDVISDNLRKDYRLNYSINTLPDIVGYLQDETHLTRKTIVAILTGCSRLSCFKLNPPKFIEGCIDIIKKQMQLHIVDGIKYQKLGDSKFYSQERFRKEELFGYLNSNLTESSKSPYKYVVYDSKVERELSDRFNISRNVRVYAKLPSWFKIETPLGTYNPDWVLSWRKEGEEKFYFGIESKGSRDCQDLRPKESMKIRCGKEHFKALNSELFVVKNYSDIFDQLQF